MKIIQLKESERIKEGLRSLTEEFIGEYPYYSTWIQKNEATYKIIKTEFAFNRIFESFEELETELFDYVNWYNNIRIHSSLNYLTPIEYKKMSL